MNFSNIYIGADPEFFIFKNGEPYPIVGLLGGSKEEPLECPEVGIFCAHLEDNVMAEFNIQPSANVEEFIKFNRDMIDVIMKKLGPDYKAKFLPAVRFDAKHLKTEQAKEFGCMPDHNAYTLEIQRVKAKNAGNLRTAGGHIHIGYEEADGSVKNAAIIARAFDLFVTMPMLLLEPDNERRQLYGKAGSFRVKDYGVECRQLSCHWLSDDKLMAWVYYQTLKALEFVSKNEEIKDPKSGLCQRVQNVIDNKLMSDVLPLYTEVDPIGAEALVNEGVTA